ncbi:MAG TPA: carboxypeptidase-like regulatory domain-containing protein [Polyangiaceae bacterium]|nr:carboxypeptidase-like regulatory domain-containing protein [Polyangiaceae bacterium]
MHARHTVFALLVTVSSVVAAARTSWAAGAPGASPVIQVRGAARVNATASAAFGSVVVTGSVIDDTGRPVGGATLELRAFAADGSAVLIPPLGACANRPTTTPGGQLLGPRAAQSLGSDTSGRFCATLVAERANSVALSFSDPRGLFDATEARVAIDRSRRGVELRLAPTTATFELERETQRVQVTTHVVAAATGVEPPLPLAVYLATPNGDVLVAQGACPIDGATEFDVPSSKLARPGPLELVLRFAGTPSLQPAEARRRVLATARVRLELSQHPAAADPTDGIPLDVAVGSAVGAVTSGSVEARLFGQTVAIGRVEHGAAHLVAQFPRRGDQAELELRYLPLEPWWRPGDPVALKVDLLSRARWVSLGWLSALGAIAAWLLLGWRRPERGPGARPATEPRAPVAGVHLLKREDDRPGWLGVVRDAHDGSPIAGAVVAIVSPSPDKRLLGRVTADEAGRFAIDGAADAGLELSVSAPLHSDFSCRAPPHGELRVDLVSRRRFLVGRLVRWAEHRGPFGRGRAEPTPGDVKRYGRKARRDEVVAWASAVEAAAFGPAPVDETIERNVVRHEPPEGEKPEPHVVKRDH